MNSFEILVVQQKINDEILPTSVDNEIYYIPHLKYFFIQGKLWKVQ